MPELSTGEFAKLHGCTLKHVNAKMKLASITGCKSVLDKRLTMLNEEEQAILEPYVNANRKSTKPEPVEEIAGEFVDDDEAIEEVSTNTALSFYVADQDANVLAIRQDTMAIANQNRDNFSAFQYANLERIKAKARRDAGELVNAYQSELQTVLNEDLTAVYGVDTAKPATKSKTVKKSVGKS